MRRHELTDGERVRLEPLLPPRRPRTGRPAKDHRTIIDALLWLDRTGAPWRDLPERHGPWRTVATRFYRWGRSGVWRRILAAPQRAADAEGRIDRSVHMVDDGVVRAHRRAAGARGRRTTKRCRSRGGFSTKLHHRRDRRGRLITFVPTAGERHEQTAFVALTTTGGVPRPGRDRPRPRPRAVLGDEGYTGEPVRAHPRRRGIAAIVPQLAGETRPRPMDWRTYRERDVIERLVGRSKDCRRIATRHDKLAASYLAFVQFAAIRIRLRKQALVARPSGTRSRPCSQPRRVGVPSGSAASRPTTPEARWPACGRSRRYRALRRMLAAGARRTMAVPRATPATSEAGERRSGSRRRSAGSWRLPSGGAPDAWARIGSAGV